MLRLSGYKVFWRSGGTRMSRASFAIVSSLAVLCTVVVSAQQTFRAQVDLVNFGVVVTDKQGAPIAGLTQDDFEIKEAGRPQAIKFFAAGDPGTAPPLHIGFLLDTSGSMEDDIKDVRTAAIKFLNAMEQAVDITLVDFDTEVRMARYASSDYARLIERIRGRRTDGYTALYDAFGVYLSGTADQIGQKILIMYTDGGDTRSTSRSPRCSIRCAPRTSPSTWSATWNTNRARRGWRSAWNYHGLR